MCLWWMEFGLQRSPMSLSSARRESDLPFIPSLLSRSRDRSLEERSRSLDDLDEKIIGENQRRNVSTKKKGAENLKEFISWQHAYYILVEAKNRKS